MQVASLPRSYASPTVGLSSQEKLNLEVAVQGLKLEVEGLKKRQLTDANVWLEITKLQTAHEDLKAGLLEVRDQLLLRPDVRGPIAVTDPSLRSETVLLRDEVMQLQGAMETRLWEMSKRQEGVDGTSARMREASEKLALVELSLREKSGSLERQLAELSYQVNDLKVTQSTILTRKEPPVDSVDALARDLELGQLREGQRLLREALEASDGRLANACADIAVTKKAMLNMEGKFNDRNLDVSGLKQGLQQYEGRLRDAHSGLASLKQDLDTHGGKMGGLYGDWAAHKSAYQKELDAHRLSHEAKVAALRDELLKGMQLHEGRLRDTHSNLASFKQDLDGHALRLNSILGDVSAMRMHDGMLRDAHTGLAALKKELEAHSGELGGIYGDLATHKSAYQKDLDAHRLAHEARLAALRDDLSKDITGHLTRANSVFSELNAAKKDLGLHHARLNGLEAEMANRMQELNAHGTRLNVMHADVNTTKKGMHLHEGKFTETLDELMGLKRAHAEHGARLTELRALQDFPMMDAKISSLQSELSLTQQELRDTKQRVLTSQAEMATYLKGQTDLEIRTVDQQRQLRMVEETLALRPTGELNARLEARLDRLDNTLEVQRDRFMDDYLAKAREGGLLPGGRIVAEEVMESQIQALEARLQAQQAAFQSDFIEKTYKIDELAQELNVEVQQRSLGDAELNERIRREVSQVMERLQTQYDDVMVQAVSGGQSAKVVVRVLGAHFLRDASWNGRGETYCVVEIPGREASKVTTRRVSNTRTPEWTDEICDMAGFVVGDPLVISVFEKRSWPSRDELLGKVHIPSKKFCPNGFVGDLPLEGGGGDAFLRVRIDLVMRGNTVEGRKALLDLDQGWVRAEFERANADQAAWKSEMETKVDAVKAQAWDLPWKSHIENQINALRDDHEAKVRSAHKRTDGLVNDLGVEMEQRLALERLFNESRKDQARVNDSLASDLTNEKIAIRDDLRREAQERIAGDDKLQRMLQGKADKEEKSWFKREERPTTSFQAPRFQEYATSTDQGAIHPTSTSQPGFITRVFGVDF